MFNSNTLQTYNFKDASQEIIIMILGAFLLGCLLTWLLSKLFKKDYHDNDTHNFGLNESYESYGHDVNHASDSSTFTDKNESLNQAVEKIVEESSTEASEQQTLSTKDEEESLSLQSEETSTNDTQTIINRDDTKTINDDIDSDLKEINHEISESELSDTSENTTDTLSTPEHSVIEDRELVSEKDIVEDFQSGTQESNTEKANAISSYTETDIELEDKQNITQILESSEVLEIQEENIIDSTSEEIEKLESEIDAIDEKNHFQRYDRIDINKLIADKREESIQGVVNSVSETLKDLEHKKNETNQEQYLDSESDSYKDDLTVIGGIDHKIQEGLNTHGIYTYTDLRDLRHRKLKAIQEKLQIHNREIDTWANQASIAAKGQWKKLKDFQSFIRKTQEESISQLINSDDLTVIEGINTEVRNALHRNDIYSFKQVREIDSALLKEILLKSDPDIEITETESWSHQAAMAEKEQWEELKIYQGFMESENFDTIFVDTDDVEKYTQTADVPISIDDTENIFDSIHNDFQKELTELENNYSNYIESEPLGTAKDELKSEKRGSNSTLTEDDVLGLSSISNLPQQQILEKNDEQHPANHENINFSYGNNIYRSLEEVSKLETEYDLNKKSIKEKDEEKSEEKSTHDENFEDHDDLKKIEGIGPKIEEVLNQGGIYTFSQLSNSNIERLNILLDKAGNRFKMHDPETWPIQASFASKGDWSALKEFNKPQIKEKNSTSRNEQSLSNQVKADVISIKDNLTKVEGIGPKIQSLLKANGISTFQSLSECSRDRLKGILNDAGPQFRMHEPESWPYQARLAAIKDWDGLKKYQDFLISGRE